MPDEPVLFDDVTVTRRDSLGFQCRIAGRVVWVGVLQAQPGSDLDVGGRRLILRRADAAELGLIDWTPGK
jgi:hypothetical protein